MKDPSRVVALFLLPVLAIAGYYCTHLLAERTGYFPSLQDIWDADLPLLPGTKVPLKKVYTGIHFIDETLYILATVFWPAVDGSYPHTSLQAFEFAGQAVAIWAIFEMEARRAGNKWTLVSVYSLPIWGVLAQTMAFTVIFPIFCFTYLLMSPLGVRSSAGKRSAWSNNLLVSASDIRALPISMTLSFVLPSIFMSLPSPTLTSFEAHQIWISVWQVFPITTAVLQFVISRLLSVISPIESKYHLAVQRNALILHHLRRVYMFLFTCSSISHIAAWTISISSVLFPSLFNRSVVAYLHPRRCFLPPLPNSRDPVADLGEGTLNFLLYDEYIGSLVTVIWAAVLNHNAHVGGTTLEWWIGRLAKIVGVSLLAGSGSATVLLLWERDELVLGASEVEESKKLS